MENPQRRKEIQDEMNRFENEISGLYPSAPPPPTIGLGKPQAPQVGPAPRIGVQVPARPPPPPYNISAGMFMPHQLRARPPQHIPPPPSQPPPVGTTLIRPPHIPSAMLPRMPYRGPPPPPLGPQLKIGAPSGKVVSGINFLKGASGDRYTVKDGTSKEVETVISKPAVVYNVKRKSASATNETQATVTSKKQKEEPSAQTEIAPKRPDTKVNSIQPQPQQQQQIPPQTHPPPHSLYGQPPHMHPAAFAQPSVVPASAPMDMEIEVDVPQTAAQVAAAAAAGQLSKKQKKEIRKRILRCAAGEVWEDPSLIEWDPNDFRMFCGDLGNETSDEVLARAFSKYASFQKAKVIRDKRTNKSKGYGFVSFKDPMDFVRAMKEMNGKYVGNRPIKLRKSDWNERSLDTVRTREKEKMRLIGK